MRKSKKTTFQWTKVSRLRTTVPRHRADNRTGLRFLFRAPEVPVLSLEKATFTAFPHFRKVTSGARNKNLIKSIRKWFSRFFSFYIGLFLILCTSLLPILQEENGPIINHTHCLQSQISRNLREVTDAIVAASVSQ